MLTASLHCSAVAAFVIAAVLLLQPNICSHMPNTCSHMGRAVGPQIAAAMTVCWNDKWVLHYTYMCSYFLCQALSVDNLFFMIAAVNFQLYLDRLHKQVAN